MPPFPMSAISSYGPRRRDGEGDDIQQVFRFYLIISPIFVDVQIIRARSYARIKGSLPAQRGNVSMTNLQVLSAILSVAEQGCGWRGLPRRFGRWHTIYMRMSRRAKNGVLDRVFEQLQLEQIVLVGSLIGPLNTMGAKIQCSRPRIERRSEIIIKFALAMETRE
jgi:hypothetical protein